MGDFELRLALWLLCTVIIYLIVAPNHGVIEDQQEVARRRQAWKEGKPYRKSVPTRLLNIWDRIIRWFN